MPSGSRSGSPYSSVLEKVPGGQVGYGGKVVLSSGYHAVVVVGALVVVVVGALVVVVVVVVV